jgi:outer membrane phospholipase A
LLKELREMEKNGGIVSVTWYYTPDDTDMNDDIMDYMVDTGLQIKLTPFEEI